MPIFTSQKTNFKGGTMNNTINQWKHLTWLIENDWGDFGTGFLIKREINLGLGNQAKGIKFFLVTNKHVLNDKKGSREDIQEITVYANLRGGNGEMKRKIFILSLHTEDGSKIWREHPDENVDVLVFDVSTLILNCTQIEHDAPTYEFFINESWLKQLDIKLGDEILVFSYPDLDNHRTIYPVVKTGTIATPLHEDLEEEIDKDYTKMTRGFLINDVTVPGASGSPVVLKPSIGRTIGRKNYLGFETPPLLLGIIAQTRYATVKATVFEGKSFAGMGLAFHSITIKETIELFFS
jgi:hypothetical protein